MDTLHDIPPQPTFQDLGLDVFGQNPLQFTNDEVNRKVRPAQAVAVPPNFLQSGNLVQQIVMTDGYMQSSNFVTGVSGWRIKYDGTSEFH